MSSQFLVGAIADGLGRQGQSGRAPWDPNFYVDVVVLLIAGLMWSSFCLFGGWWSRRGSLQGMTALVNPSTNSGMLAITVQAD